MPSGHPHHQAGPCSGIAKIKRPVRLAQAANANAPDMPYPVFRSRHMSAKCSCGLCRVQNIITFQQAFNTGFTNGQKPQDQRPMRDRFIAWDTKFTLQGCAGLCGKRGLIGI
jgi:hypothetical protein